MKYFPEFKREIDIERKDITTGEIANVMSQIHRIQVMAMGDDYINCRKPSVGKNNIVPDIDIFLVKKENATQLRCVFHLRNEVQILYYIASALLLAMQIGKLITSQGEVVHSDFRYLAILLITQLLTFLLMHIQACNITQQLEAKVK